MATYGHQGGYAFNEDQRDAMRDTSRVQKAANIADATLDRIEAKRRLSRLVDWIYQDDSESLPIAQVELELREAGIDMDRATKRLRELLSRYDAKEVELRKIEDQADATSY